MVTGSRSASARSARSLLVPLHRRREIARPERIVPGGARVGCGDERGARGRELVRARHGALDVFVDIAFEGRSIHALGRRRRTRGGGECAEATAAPDCSVNRRRRIDENENNTRQLDAVRPYDEAFVGVASRIR